MLRPNAPSVRQLAIDRTQNDVSRAGQDTVSVERNVILSQLTVSQVSCS